ncbi:MAG: hypothetical protein K0R31_1154 [Clostridiales bacterium]|nr:hypothetical protein [Clostridiales bacterium]
MIFLPKHISFIRTRRPTLPRAGKILFNRKARPLSRPVLKLRLPQLPIYQLQSKSKPERRKSTKITVANPLQNVQNIMKGITTSLNRLTNSSPKEDYTAVVRPFLPLDAELLIPQYPAKSASISRLDIDGDLNDELIASYRQSNEITTLVLKKQEDQWRKIAEIKNPGFDSVNFLGHANITGEGSKQLLLGLKSRDNMGILNGYNINKDGAQGLFSHNYHQLDVLGSSTKEGKSQLAFWEGVGNDAYRVEVKHWNGSQLEPIDNQSTYYKQKMLPYYGQRVRQSPQNPSNWYNLADALVKAGMNRDGLKAIELGISLKPDETLKEDFIALRKKISEI